MTCLEIAFSRSHMRLVTSDVRKHFPGIKVSKAWVYNFGRDHWEFHGPDDFYWHGRASNAFDARAKGWGAYLRKMGKDIEPMTIRPVRLQLRRTKGYNLQSLSRSVNGLSAINCARPSRWGNCYKIGDTDIMMNDGTLLPKIRDAADAIAPHREMLLHNFQIWPDLLAPLRGHNLACWCAPDAPCHADTLLELAQTTGGETEG